MTRRWTNGTGAVVLLILSAWQEWLPGLALGALFAALAIAAKSKPAQSASPDTFLLLDASAVGVGMVVIGNPTVAAVLVVLVTFVASVLLDVRRAIGVSGYLMAWAAVAHVASTVRSEPTLPAASPVVWIVSVTVFAVVVVLAVSSRVLDSVDDVDRLRAQFLGGVAHDLRNPLAGVTGAAAVLQDAAGDLTAEEVDEMVALILSQAGEADRMVGDLLVSARLDASALDVEPQLVDLGALVAETLAMVATTEPGRPIGFDNSGPPKIALVDPMRTRQVVLNLVTNAIRYGHDQIEIDIADRGGEVVVRVIDDGPGIPEQERDHIFGAFARASGAQHAASVGLGLAVARRLARLMDGDLSYTRVDDLSVFELTVPSAPASAMPGGDVPNTVRTEFASVSLVDGVLTIHYQPASGVEDRTHVMALLDAARSLTGGAHYPMMVVTGGLRPSREARQLYAQVVDESATAVAVVVAGSPFLTGMANLITSQLGLTVPMRVFASRSQGLAWVVAHPQPGSAPVGSSASGRPDRTP